MLARGISPDAISMVEEELSLWLDGFHHPVDNVVQVVQKIRANPLIPNDVPVHGLIFEPHSGEVKVVSDGYS
jgi:carbonic anhydrase